MEKKNETVRCNAEIEVAKGQAVKLTGHFTTIGTATVVPCGKDEAAYGVALGPAAPGENVDIEVK